jgi:cell division protein FtsL
MPTSIKPWLYLGAALLLAATLVFAYHKGHASADAAWELKVTKLKADQEAQAREVERNTQSKMEKIQDAAEKQIALARTDAAVADAAADSLHKQAAAYARRLSSCSTTAGSGQADGRGAAVLADLLERADKRAGELAAALDRSRVAGAACQAAYDGVRHAAEN